MLEGIIDRLGEQFVYNPAAPMIFSSGFFLWLFAGFMVIYTLLEKKDNARILFVILFSYYFYYKSSGIFFFLLAIVTVSDYYIARFIGKTESKSGRKWLVTLSLAVNLGLLCYFKYTNFFARIWSDLVGSNFDPFDIFLPVGISFFTFQSLSYTIDVYRRKIQPLDRLMDYAFFVSFFPQLVAGPIVRAKDFIPQIRKPVLVTREMLGTGIYFIVCGLFKKVVISDYISVNFVERVFENPSLYSGIENLFGVYGYALQIYCDFSGYSDMAIGLALLLGFHFPLNFRSPYKASSITEFWHRWHISLSTWLRDYLYISMGGNRRGKLRTYFNLFMTMLLGGLWHGASWNFVFWGAIHGIALALHKFWRSLLGRDKHYQSRGIRRVLGILLTFHLVCLCWIFFRNSTFEASWTMIHQIVANFQPQLFGQLVDGYKMVFAFMAVGFVLHFLPDRWEEACQRGVIRLPLVAQALLLILIIYVVIQVKTSDIQPFIYFQF